jgi:N12 class adenine-specific DNA methylase
MTQIAGRVTQVLIDKGQQIRNFEFTSDQKSLSGSRNKQKKGTEKSWRAYVASRGSLKASISALN